MEASHGESGKSESSGSETVSCPFCQTAMTEGKVVVHGTLGGFLTVGFSHQHCWFQPLDGSKEEKIVHSPAGLLSLPSKKESEPTGFRCDECRAVLIRTGHTK